MKYVLIFLISVSAFAEHDQEAISEVQDKIYKHKYMSCMIRKKNPEICSQTVLESFCELYPNNERCEEE